MSLKHFLKGGAAVMPTLMESERNIGNSQYPRFDAGYGEYDDGYGVNFIIEPSHDTTPIMIGDTHIAFHPSLR